MKEKCLENVKDAVKIRESIFTIASDVMKIEKRHGFMDASGFNYVVSNYENQLRKLGFESAANWLEKAMRDYPTPADQSPNDTVAWLMQAAAVLGEQMFPMFCECEKQ